MALLHNHNTKKLSLLHSVGEKIKYGAEVAGAVKTIFDTGKTIYTTLSPVLSVLI